MPRSVAFLRAINVGGRRVSSDDLIRLFADLDVENVNTFLASGNVIFDAEAPSEALESQIAAHLQDELGYEVPTFVRSMDDVRTLAATDPFDAVSDAATVKTYVVFARSPLSSEQKSAIAALQTPVDQFVAEGRHIFWRRDLDAGESKTTGELETVLECPLTRRTSRTLERIVSKFA